MVRKFPCLKSFVCGPLVLAATLGLTIANPSPSLAQECTAIQICGDVNDSGEVSSSDALAVLRKGVGIPQSLFCECGLDAENWSWSGTIIGNDPAEEVFTVPEGSSLLLADVHGTSNTGSGVELKISDSSGVRYVRALSTAPFDVAFAQPIVFGEGEVVTVYSNGGTTQLTLTGLVSPAP